jgi:hypothetical protein
MEVIPTNKARKEAFLGIIERAAETVRGDE